MRRETPIFSGVIVLAIVLSFLTGSTAASRRIKPVGSAPVVARTLICPAVNGQPNHTVSNAYVTDVGAALPTPLHASGTVTSTLLLGRKSTTTTLKVQPWAGVQSHDGQNVAVALTSEGSISASLAAGEIIETSDGRYRALAAGACLPPATDWWFAGGNGKLGFTDRLLLANAGATDAEVGVTLWTPTGPSSSPRLAAIRVPARSLIRVGIFAVAPDISTVAMHVHADSGSVTAVITDRRTNGLDSDGGDLVAPTLPPSRDLVINGFPDHSGSSGLVVTNPGTSDATVSVKVATPNGEYTPSSVTNFVVGAGKTSTVDMSKALNASNGAVLLSSDQPVIAAGQATITPAGRKLRPDFVWLPATRPITAPTAVAVGREADGGDCLLLLSAPEGAGSVRITTPTGATRTISVAAGHSLEVNITDTVKTGSGPWPFVVTSTGSGPVYVSRELHFLGAHGELVTTEPVTPLPSPIPLPAVRYDPRLSVR